MKQNGLTKIIQEDPSLIWYVRKHSHISDMSILEHILNYGNWKQVQEAIKILGMKDTVQLYTSLANKRRSNLMPRVKHYFDLYFAHASGNPH
ncbi:hypothetical protein CO051_06200 [Candidatus Roizmanbacteria bacterium CG_4_9_14_0_2_um_filter_39_13]|uniref:Uncharacterized protein n=2 Tax=Candidatus Roizmaniibacteriota TaxID=1752723 RepID=A0A2M8EWU5_9BACT|nr:MAG: hypothetical protein COY15_02625 [Candidatus Roizmanbacteria bacterium CG_4_10_14_0_2_um_filter_39_12]PJC30335.1 MAG: hypothetical protein CO051_06200 [Candidatus Roizmanbacteria bacterium CG_4_9_14_0_2_um_filter_39_13]PJE61669.1 MAG: hypothetical protein COU87_03465 [Candidatus Roizmanbacteria bacterium CG10_big_fil_rev_8_21_14_0_10_39_12]